MFLFWEGNTAENLDKNHQAEEESLKLWVVQVGKGTNGVKNLFVVKGKKKTESTAADSLVIVCFVEVSQSCREKRPPGAHLTLW